MKTIIISFCYGLLLFGDSFISKADKLPPSRLLYLVTDKTLYTPGEVVWFSGYLLNNGKQTDTLQPDIVSVALVLQGDTVASLRKNYFMDSGLCAGSLTLPDSLSAGSYELVACCNVFNSSGMPVYVFRKPLTVKTLEPSAFNLMASFDDKSSEDSLHVSLRLTVADSDIPKNKRNSLSYGLKGQMQLSVKLGAMDSLSVSLPWKDIAASNHYLYTSVSYNGATKPFVFSLPHGPEEKVQVKFFPEYGKLISGKKQQVLWQCAYSDNTPAAKKALLVCNNNVIDTLRTDSSGMGKFYLASDANASSYSVRIVQGQQVTLPDFPLPKAESNNLLLTADNTLFNDTLNMAARTDQPSTFRFALRDKDTTMPLTAFMNADSVKNLKFVLDGLSKGIHRIEVQNIAGNTTTQKTFFAHCGNSDNIELTTNKKEYTPREKVGVDINMEGDSSLQGVYTLYCVQTSRLEPEKQMSMEAYYYTYPLTEGNINILSYHNQYWMQNRMESWNYNNDAKEDPSYPHGTTWYKPALKGKVMFEESGIMRKYSKSGKVDPAAVNPGMGASHTSRTDWLAYDDAEPLNIPEGSNSNKKIKDSLQVVIKRASGWNFLPVDNGVFFPKAKDLVIPEDGSLFAMAAPIADKSNSTRYAVQTEDPMEKPTIRTIQFLPAYTPVAITNRKNDYLLKDTALGHMLQTVTVTSRKDGFIADAHYANPCGDYVCPFGILDCSEHPPGTPGNTLPIKGHEYKIVRTRSLKTIVYQGCTTNSMVGIYTTRRFIGMDSARMDSEEKSMLSTLYWQPFVFAQGNAKLHFEFYTEDLQGSFKLIAEGIDAKGEIFYKEVPFTIKGK